MTKSPLQLGCRNNNESYQKQAVNIAFVLDSNIYFIFDKPGRRRDRFYKFDTTTLTLEEFPKLEDREEDDNWGFNTAFTIGNTQYKFQNSQLTISNTVTDNSEDENLSLRRDLLFNIFTREISLAENNLDSENTADEEEPPAIKLEFSIDTAFVGRDNNIYIFKGQKFIVFPVSEVSTVVEQINNWSNSQPQNLFWGRIYNNIVETGIVDAAFVRNKKLYLFSGDEYLVYSDFPYNYAESGYPKPILDNTEDLPSWNNIKAAFTNSKSKKSYFFGKIPNQDSEEQYFVESSNLNQENPVKSKCGRLNNNFTETGIVDSAYVKGDYLFMTSGNQFIRYTLTQNQPIPKFIDKGYPKQIQTNIPELTKIKVDAALNKGNELYFFYNGSNPGRRVLKMKDVYARSGIKTIRIIKLHPNKQRNSFLMNNLLHIYKIPKIFYPQTP